MPRWGKVVLWVVVFALCAGAGAWVASRTDPFPPGVDDPGARPSAVTSPPTAAVQGLWSGDFTARTEHRLHVGGTCRSDWRATYRLRLRPDGTIRGDLAVAVLEPGSARCDFEQAQTQAGTVDLGVDGTWDGHGARLTMSLRFRERGVDPPGSLDLGGFLGTIETVEPVMGAGASTGEVEAGRRVSVPDGNQGSYLATYRFTASCRRGCA